jgi:3-deoxy-D-manno-octulosonic-acid transferase
VSRSLARIRFPLLAYNAAWVIFLIPWLVYRLLTYPFGKRITLCDRLGLYPNRPRPFTRTLWIHAVSVGELASIRPLVEAFRADHPEVWIVLTTNNSHAYALAQKSPAAHSVHLMPWDFTPLLSNAIDRVRPDALAIVECEIWPGAIAAFADRGIPISMINARIYEADFPRYRFARSLFAPLLRAISRIGAQSPADRARFLNLGADPARTFIGGNTKWDAVAQPDAPVKAERMREALHLAGRRIFILASTHPDEELQLLAHYRPLRDMFLDLSLVIAPRHPERGAELFRQIQSLGYSVLLRSRWRDGDEPFPEIVILDTLGELPQLLPAADLVFIGGSLVPAGGHNPIEPAIHGKPILIGPSVHNFADIVAAFESADGLIRLNSARQIMEEAKILLADAPLRQSLGQRARQTVDRHRGALNTWALILESHVFRHDGPIGVVCSVKESDNTALTQW